MFKIIVLVFLQTFIVLHHLPVIFMSSVNISSLLDCHFITFPDFPDFNSFLKHMPICDFEGSFELDFSFCKREPPIYILWSAFRGHGPIDVENSFFS